MTDVGAGGCDSRSGAGAPRWHPAAHAVSLFWDWATAGFSSQGPGHGAVGSAGWFPPTSPSLCTPQGGEGLGQVGGGSQKFHQENTFCHFPKPQLSPAQCQAVGAAAPAPTAPLWVMRLQSDSLAFVLIPALGSHARCPSLQATCHLVWGSPRPQSLLEPRGHTQLPALSWPHGPWEPRQIRVAHQGTGLTVPGPRGRRVQVADWSASATAPSGPAQGRLRSAFPEQTLSWQRIQI